MKYTSAALTALVMLLVLGTVSAQVVYTTYTTSAVITQPCSVVVQLPRITSSTTVSTTCSATIPITYTSTSTVTTTPPSTTTTTTTSSFANGNNVYWMGESSPHSMNTGVYSIIQVLPQHFGNGFGGCLSFWVGDNSFSSGAWGQVGYYACNGGGPQAFYQIWNMSTYSVIDANTIPITIGNHNFSMYLSAGTSWNFAVDNATFGTFDMGINTPGYSEPIFALSEQSGVSAPQPFVTDTFVSAINVRSVAGVWVHPNVSIYEHPGVPWVLQMQGPNSFTVGDTVLANSPPP